MILMGINDDVDNCPEFYPNQEDKTTMVLVIICIEEEQVKVAGFSPNGDGINDTWFIKNVENYPNTQVRVLMKQLLKCFSRDYKIFGTEHTKTLEIVAAGSYFIK
jgi:hypothetical protein